MKRGSCVRETLSVRCCDACRGRPNNEAAADNGYTEVLVEDVDREERQTPACNPDAANLMVRVSDQIASKPIPGPNSKNMDLGMLVAAEKEANVR